MKRVLMVPMVIGLVSSPMPLLADETADSCRVCHKDALTLEDWQAADLESRLRQLRDGGAEHVVPIPKLSDADLRALAAALAGS